MMLKVFKKIGLITVMEDQISGIAIAYRIASAVCSKNSSTYKALQQFNSLKIPSYSSVKNKCKYYNK